MKISETAKQHHDALFPASPTTLSTSDPELIAIFDNFAYDEVLQYGELATTLRMKLILASLIAMQTMSEYEIMVEAAMRVGVTPIEIKEIVYQCTPYLGIAKVIDALQITNTIFTSKGISLPLPTQATTDSATRYDSGRAVQTAIFGKRIEQMYQQAPANQLHIQEYLSKHCFGDFYTREGLDIATRELLTFVMLISMGGCEAQVKGHIQGNVNVGNDKLMLLTVVTHLLPYIGYPRTLHAIACINEVLPDETE